MIMSKRGSKEVRVIVPKNLDFKAYISEVSNLLDADIPVYLDLYSDEDINLDKLERYFIEGDSYISLKIAFDVYGGGIANSNLLNANSKLQKLVDLMEDYVRDNFSVRTYHILTKNLLTNEVSIVEQKLEKRDIRGFEDKIELSSDKKNLHYYSLTGKGVEQNFNKKMEEEYCLVYEFVSHWENLVFKSTDVVKEPYKLLNKEDGQKLLKTIDITGKEDLQTITTYMTEKNIYLERFQLEEHKQLIKSDIDKKLHEINEASRKLGNTSYINKDLLVREIEKMPEYAEVPISQLTVSYTKKVVDEVLRATESIRVFPTNIGKIQIDFNVYQCYLEIEVGENSIEYLYEENEILGTGEKEGTLKLEEVEDFVRGVIYNG